MKKKLIAVLFVLIFISFSFGQEKQEVKTEEEKTQETEQVKAWRLPAHMQEALISILNQKVEEFKDFLILNVKGFEDMPKNVVFDFTSGIFLTPESVQKLQEQQKKVPIKTEVIK